MAKKKAVQPPYSGLTAAAMPEAMQMQPMKKMKMKKPKAKGKGKKKK